MSATKKQTAVQWLEKEFVKLESTIGIHGVMYELIEQAKEMEKEQIKDAWLDAWKDSVLDPLEDKYYEPIAEQYYNETYETI